MESLDLKKKHENKHMPERLKMNIENYISKHVWLIPIISYLEMIAFSGRSNYKRTQDLTETKIESQN